MFSATLAYVSYYQLLAMLGVENYGNRSIAAAQGNRERQKNLFWNIYAIQFFSSFIAIILYGISFFFISADRFQISLLQGLWLIGTLLNINWFFFGTEQFRLTVTRNIVIKILTVALIVIFVKEPDDVFLYVLIMAGDVVLSNLIMWPFLIRNIGFEKPQFRHIKKHVGSILVLFIPILAMSVFHIMDKTMLDWLGTESEVGFYYSADKVINIPLSIITALGTVMLPRISNEFSKGNREGILLILKKTTELTIFLTCAVGIGIASIANEFIPWFFGPGFEACIILVYWFVPILFAKAIGDLIRTQYMIPTQKDKLYIIAVFIGAGVNLVANYFLIQRFGALGAVLGTFIAEASVSICELFFTRNDIPFFLYIANNSIYLISATIMFACVRRLARELFFPIGIKLFVMVVLGGIIYIFCNLVIWRLKPESIFRDIKIIDKKRGK